MSTERDKIIFERTLKGEPIGKDIFDRVILEGDIIAYAVGSRMAEMKIGKIVDVIRKETPYGRNKTETKVKVVRLEKNHWRAMGAWSKGERPSYLTNFDNVIKIEDAPQDILDLFEEENDE